MYRAVRNNLLRGVTDCAITGRLACGNAKCCLADTETFHGVTLSNPGPLPVDS